MELFQENSFKANSVETFQCLLEYKCGFKVDIRYLDHQRHVVKKIVIAFPVVGLRKQVSDDISVYDMNKEGKTKEKSSS